jgi:tetratricopeptide (TPR) repeat protein
MTAICKHLCFKALFDFLKEVSGMFAPAFFSLGALLACALFSQTSFAQNLSSVDSLIQIAARAKTENNETLALRMYMQASRILEKGSTDEQKKQLLGIYLNIGKIYEKRNLHENALEYYQKANTVASNQGVSLRIAQSLFELKKYEEALEAYWTALQEIKKKENLREELELLRKIVLC